MLNPMDMSGRRILVTGASSGIGRETAIFLSQLGVQLILVARNTERLESTKNDLSGSGHLLEPYDLEKIDDIPSWLKKITDRVGPLSGLVHSAGIHLAKPVRMLKHAEVQKIYDINVGAVIGLVKAFRQKNVCLPN